MKNPEVAFEIKRRDGEQEYWQNVCQSFSSLHLEIMQGSKDVETNIRGILARMRDGEHPFGHHRVRQAISAEEVRVGFTPPWKVIGVVVGDELNLGNLEDQASDEALRRAMEYRAKCLLRLEESYRKRIPELSHFGLLGEAPQAYIFCGDLLVSNECSCDFHRNRMAVAGLKAKKRLLTILPKVVNGLEEALKPRGVLLS